MPNFRPQGLENKASGVHLRYYTKTFFFFSYFERNDVNEFSETKPHFKEEMWSQFGDISKDSVHAYKKEGHIVRMSTMLFPLRTVAIIAILRTRAILDVCVCMHTQSCPILCNPMVCSPPASSVHGIFQARILEQAAISFSRGSTSVSCISCIAREVLCQLSHWGSRDLLNELKFPEDKPSWTCWKYADSLPLSCIDPSPHWLEWCFYRAIHSSLEGGLPVGLV